MSSVIDQLVLVIICYEIRLTNTFINSLTILISIDNICNFNVEKQLDEANIQIDVNYETFTLLLLNNILFYEGSTLIDCSLIIGNQMDTLLSGFMVVFTLYYTVARYIVFIFSTIFIQSFVFQIQQFLFLLSLIEFISIFFRTLTLPNRLSLNLFSGNLLINIFLFPFIDHSLTQLIQYLFTIIVIYEINNGSLQLFIFSLLSMNYFYIEFQ